MTDTLRDVYLTAYECELKDADAQLIKFLICVHGIKTCASGFGHSILSHS